MQSKNVLLISKNKSAQLLVIISTIVLISCNPHIDSVYLGRSESKFVDDVSQGNTKAVKAYLGETIISLCFDKSELFKLKNNNLSTMTECPVGWWC